MENNDQEKREAAAEAPPAPAEVAAPLVTGPPEVTSPAAIAEGGAAAPPAAVTLVPPAAEGEGAEEDEEGKDELPGVFLRGHLLFQCLSCGGEIAVDVDNPSAADIVNLGGVLEQRVLEEFEADCPECSKAHPSAIPFFVPTGALATKVGAIVEGMQQAIEEGEDESEEGPA